MVFQGYIPPKNPDSKNFHNPCPICGSVSAVGRNLHHFPQYMCVCRECGYYGPKRLTRRRAIRAWNKRKESRNGDKEHRRG